MYIYRMTNVKTGEIIEGPTTELCEKVLVTDASIRNCCRNKKLLSKTWLVERIEDAAELHKHYVRLGLYRTCTVCGKEFLADKFTIVCCGSKCSEKRRYDAAKGSIHKYYYDKPRPVKKKGKESLAVIAAKARSAGMTYGQYVVKMGL